MNKTYSTNHKICLHWDISDDILTAETLPYSEYLMKCCWLDIMVQNFNTKYTFNGCAVCCVWGTVWLYLKGGLSCYTNAVLRTTDIDFSQLEVFILGIEVSQDQQGLVHPLPFCHAATQHSRCMSVTRSAEGGIWHTALRLYVWETYII